MGDPRKIRGKYQGPRHPWNKERIEEERTLVKNYGLSNKKELWKVGSALKHFKDTTKRLIAQTGPQADIERKQHFDRLQSLGLASADSSADTILGLKVEQLLDRRLQTLVYKHELAKSPKQARQFITHGHIMVGDNKVNAPGMIVNIAQEHHISFRSSSHLAQADHPERHIPQKMGVKSEAVTVIGEDHQVETSAQTEEMPVKKTKKKAEKVLEAQIEDETAHAKEIESAVEEAEEEQ